MPESGYVPALIAAAGAKNISMTRPIAYLNWRGSELYFAQPRAPMANDITRLRRLAEKCDLSQPPGRAVQDLKQLAVTVMCLGRGEDVEELIAILGKDFLRRTLRESPAVLFREKDWYYWHRHLNGWDTPVPPMPKRSLSSS